MRLRIACVAPLLFAAAHAQTQLGEQPVGVASGGREIRITATATGTVSRVEVLTLGSAQGDFAAGPGASNCASAHLAVGGDCTQSVAFTPAAPGLRLGAVVLVGTANGANTVLGVTYLSGNGTGGAGVPVAEDPIPAAEPAGYFGGVEDGEPATQTVPDEPGRAARDGAGNLYIAEAGRNRIRMVCGAAATPTMQGTGCAGAGIATTIAGDGDAAYTGDGGPAANATLNDPGNVALDGAGNLYIADTGNNAIRVINAVTGAISTVAGNTNGAICNGASDSVGDGCPARQATLDQPQSATVDASANLYIADTGNNAIRLVSRATGAISTVAVASTTTTIASSLDPSGFAQSVTFTVTVIAAAGSGSLTGTVSLSDTCDGKTTTLASGLSPNASGAVAVSISTLAVGQHAIVATYNNANDPAHAASTSSPALVETVLEGTAVRLTSSVNPALPGQSVTFTATVSSSGGGVQPTGTVTLMDGDTVLGAPTLSGSGAASYTTSSLVGGGHQIVALYSGSSSTQVEGSTSPVLDQTVQAPSSIAVASSLNPSPYGVPVTFTATVTSASALSAMSPATGTVSFLDNGVAIGTGTLGGSPGAAKLTISALPAGAHAITVTYAGDASNYGGGSSAPFNQAVAQGPTVTTVSVAPAPGIAGAPVTLSATVALAQGAAPLTGTVNFTSGGTLVGSAALNAAGAAAIATTLAAGTYQIVAAYQGNANALGSASNVPACSSVSPVFCSGSAALFYTVMPAATQTALSVSPGTALAASPVAFTATVTSNGTAPAGSVNFLANGAVIGTSLLKGGTALYTDAELAAGSYVLTAEYLGNANDAISVSAGLNETLSPIPTTTALASAATSGADPQVTLTATVAGIDSGPEPTGTVTFMNGATTLGTATLGANGAATLTPNLIVGTNYNIDALYGGDSYHASSASQTLVVAGAATAFTVTVTPATIAIPASQSATVTVTLASIANFTDTVSLSCASLPAAVNCRFAAASLNLPPGGTATTQLTIGASGAARSSAAIDRRASRGRFLLAGLFLPFSLLCGGLRQRLRRNHARLLAMLLPAVLAVAASLAAGCAASLIQPATPGNYVMQVTGTGAVTNVVRSQSVNLDITP